MDNTGINPIREGLLVLQIAKRLKQIQPNVLLTYTPKINIYVSIAARTLGIPVIANLSGLGRAFSKGKSIELVTRRLYKIALRHPAIVFFQNETDRADFLRDGLVEERKTERLPGSGVDVTRFRPLPRTRASDEFVFLLAARLLWDKGVREFVDAARQVKALFPKAHFLIAGFLAREKRQDAVSMEQIAQWRHESVIEFIGATDNMAELYAQSDCVVLPSYYREGVPRSLLEAAAMQVPVITTDLPGCRDAVDDGVSGLLCRPKDADHLASCMLRLTQLTEHERTAMGRAGREKVLREFDEKFVIDRYRDAVASITHPGLKISPLVVQSNVELQ